MTAIDAAVVLAALLLPAYTVYQIWLDAYLAGDLRKRKPDDHSPTPEGRPLRDDFQADRTQKEPK